LEQSDEVNATFSIKKELADRLPKGYADLQVFLPQEKKFVLY
jgi:hypothetical protein